MYSLEDIFYDDEVENLRHAAKDFLQNYESMQAIKDAVKEKA